MGRQRLWHCWVPLRKANAYVAAHHRHLRNPPPGHLFAIQANEGDRAVGVAIVGRPVAYHLQDGFTAEVRRLCTDGTRNACSYLYSACWRAAQAMGFRRLVTYIRDDEHGTSLNAAGWRQVGSSPARGWDRPRRPRLDTHDVQGRLRFEVTAE